MEIIPRIGLERRVEKTRTCFRRAGYKEPRCFSRSCSCSWSGSSLPPPPAPGCRAPLFGGVQRNQCAEQCSAPPAPRHMHTAALHSEQTHRRRQAGEMRVRGRGTEGRKAGWECRSITNEYVSCLFSMIKCRQGGAARVKFIIFVSCTLSAVGVGLRSGGGVKKGT